MNLSENLITEISNDLRGRIDNAIPTMPVDMGLD
jgi:hypothetical protein